MGLFDKLKRKEETDTKLEESWVNQLNIDTSDFYQLYSACIAKMHVVQNRIAETVVKDQDWNVDFTQGFIQFGKDTYPVQMIGSESKVSNTWLWGWENINHFPENVLELTNSTKELGVVLNQLAFTTASFELDDLYNGHNLSTVACGLSNKQYGYYRCAHDQGAAFVAFSDIDENVFKALTVSEFVQTIQDIISQRNVDHKTLVHSLLIWNQTEFDIDQNITTCKFEQELVIEFEEIQNSYRIKEMKYTM